jgi:hypothetical protein
VIPFCPECGGNVEPVYYADCECCTSCGMKYSYSCQKAVQMLWKPTKLACAVAMNNGTWQQKSSSITL